MANNFKPWVDTPTAGQQVQSASVFASDTQRVAGFKAGDPASALRVNSALRQANIVIAGLMQFCDEVETLPNELSLLSTVTQVKNAIKASIDLLHDTTLSSAKAYTDTQLADFTETATETFATLQAVDEMAVKYNEAQSLTELEKAQARSNIDVYSTGEVDGMAVKYSGAQSLTEAQKTQARSNIDVYSTSETSRTITSVAELGLTYPCSAIDILNALISQNVYNVEVRICVSSVTETVTGLPSNFGLLIIKTPPYLSILRLAVEFTSELGDGTTKQYLGNITRLGDTVTALAFEEFATSSFLYGPHRLTTTNTISNWVKFMEIDYPNENVGINLAGYVKRNSFPGNDYANKVMFTCRRQSSVVSIGIQGETSINPTANFGTFHAIMDNTNRKISLYYKQYGTYSAATITWVGYSSFTWKADTYTMMTQDTGSATTPTTPTDGAAATLAYTDYTQLATRTVPLLWSGNFTSGSIAVPGISNYKMIVVGVGDGPIPFIAMRSAYGNSFLGSGNYYIATHAIDMSVSGDTVTYGDCAFIEHNPEGVHGGKVSGVPIKTIYGVI